MLKASVLGQLLLMQSILVNLPDKKSIFSFVCRGLQDIPGIKSAQYSEVEFKEKKKNDFIFSLKRGATKFGFLLIEVTDPESFEPYYQYVENFIFMIEVILEERNQFALNQQHKNELEIRVEERTELLKKEIEQRKITEENLRQSEEKYRSLFENMTTGFVLHEIICNKKGEPIDYKYIEANPAYEKLTGLPIEKIKGKRVKEILPNIEEYWIKTFGEVALSGKSTSFQNYVKDLNKYFDTWIFSPAKNQFAVVFTDITEQILAQKKLKKNEADLKKQNQNYEALNEELIQTNEELALAKEKAEESDKLKSAFLANMSHEVRTPMNGIIGFSDMLLKPGLSEEKKSFFGKTIISCSQQLLKIVNDILDISKIEAGEIKISKDEIVLNDLLMEIYATYKLKTHEKTIDLQIFKGLKDIESQIYTDRTRFSQILTNLLENAFKFTHQGSIRIGYERHNDSLKFFVKDTGIGIKPEMQSQIFERFRQVELEMTKQYGGTGLGLSISKKLVELLGGQIWLESEEGKGTTFFFTIPYEPIEQYKLIYDNASITEWQNEKTILVVEDIETNFLLIEEMLTNTNLNILHARNGLEAIEMSNKNPKICLILMDIKMPKMNGYTAAKKIKLHRPNLPIVAQSAYAQEKDIQKFSDYFDDYITKPINHVKLNQIIKEYLFDSKTITTQKAI